MAREFAKKFYKSKEWQRCREAVMKRDYYLCVECGAAGKEVHHKKHITPKNINDPTITLNISNLVTLCKDCHHKAHERNQYTNHNELEDGLTFDEEGNLIQEKPISPHI